MIAIGLACLSAILFGGMSVGLRIGLSRHPGVELATICTVVGALAVGLVAAIAEVPSRGVHATAAWPFLLAGLLQPGIAPYIVPPPCSPRRRNSARTTPSGATGEASAAATAAAGDPGTSR